MDCPIHLDVSIAVSHDKIISSGEKQGTMAILYTISTECPLEFSILSISRALSIADGDNPHAADNGRIYNYCLSN